jgi:transposase
MELHWAVLARAGAPKGWSRAPVEGEPCRVQWHSVDLEDRRSVGRPARPASVVSDMSPPVSAVGPLGRAAEHPRRPRPGTHRRRLSGSAGSVYRRELRPRQAGRSLHRKDEAGQGIEDHGHRRSSGAPVAIHVESATPHEVRLVHATLAERFVRQLPKRLIGDSAYESDRLDAELARRRGELIAPHRRTRKQRTQDGRPLRRYRRRWKVERLFAWLQNFRRIVVRYERVAENFLGMLHLACSLILLRGL